MTREQAKVLLPIIQAFSEGKTIQSRCITGETPLWWDDNNPTFEIDDFDYRIKPEPKYRSFRNAEECWNEMKKHKPFGWIKCKEGYFNIGFNGFFVHHRMMRMKRTEKSVKSDDKKVTNENIEYAEDYVQRQVRTY